MRSFFHYSGSVLVVALGLVLVEAIGCGKSPSNAPAPAKPTVIGKKVPSPVAAKAGEIPAAGHQPSPSAKVGEEIPDVRVGGVAVPTPAYVYNPEARRDPFLSLASMEKVTGKELLPPLQRVNLSQVQVIGIVWGTFGYTAMVQMPDGKGYSIRPGTRIGASGVVRRISENAVLVEEPYVDFMGEKKMRVTKLTLHPREEGEE